MSRLGAGFRRECHCIMFSRLRLHNLPGVLSNLVAVGLVIAMAVAALVLRLVDPIPLQNLRLAQFDQLQRWYPRAYSPVGVRVVDIDEASLKEYGQWPWPRTRLAELVSRLHSAGAAVVVFDVLLAEPDRTSPARMAQLWNDPKVSALLQTLPDNDLVLQKSFEAQNVVLGSSLARSGQRADPLNGPGKPDLPYRIIHDGGGDPARWLNAFDSIVLPLPHLMVSAKGVGALNFASDADGVVRRVPMLVRLGNDIVPSLSAEALRVAHGTRNYVLRSNDAGMTDVRIGDLTVPTDSKGEIWLYYTRPQPDRYVSAARVLDGQVGKEKLEGDIVLVGSSAAGLMDLRFSPMGGVMPGVETHALALEQILLGQYLERPAWVGGLEALVIVLCALTAGLFALASSAWSAVLAMLVVLAVMVAGGCYAFAAHHLLLDAIYPALVAGFGFALGGSIHHWLTERERRWVREAFSRYVSPNRVAHLVAHHERLQLGGRRQTCSFVFTDLAGFTSMMEAGDPAQAVAQLNEYLDGMVAIVFKHDGTLDRIVGDALAVLFSAPVPQQDHRQRAMDCALEMDRFATAYALRLRVSGVAWGYTRIGVHTGEVIVGNFGGKTLFDYRALGDPINTASRLESVNKHLGTRVCVSRAILDGCTGVPARLVGFLVLKGKVQPLEVYEPLAATNAELTAPAADYAAGMRLLRPLDPPDPDSAGLALAHFELLIQKYPHDPLVSLHLARLRSGAQDDLIVMQEK
ncbi:adenylate/guanylate cyclase domain-containing protein [Polaromonas sp. C04]|uniref:CHASE2 domain-containing protein n=1 Tax=Polaromonas sp. C04 TaxID=1945857 RepID=UPI00256FAD8D|nr:adenylate/guanylate cyclase domain-containing protein [Polaromonas sp. C04]